MNPMQEVKLLNYLQRIAIACEQLAKELDPNAERHPPKSLSNDIQHVGYDDAQCGREK